MPLSLIRRSTTPPESPAVLSPARQALAAIIAAIVEAERRVEELAAPGRALVAAEIAERDASAALDAVAALEQERLRLFSENGGRMPEPMSALRSEKAAALASAHQCALEAKRHMLQVEPMAVRAHEHLRALHAQRKAAVAAVLVETARDAARQLQALGERRAALEGTLVGLREHFAGPASTPLAPEFAFCDRLLSGDDPASEVHAPIGRVLSDKVAASERARLRHGRIATKNFRAAQAMAAALLEQAGAVLEIDPVDPSDDQPPGAAA